MTSSLLLLFQSVHLFSLTPHRLSTDPTSSPFSADNGNMHLSDRISVLNACAGLLIWSTSIIANPEPSSTPPKPDHPLSIQYDSNPEYTGVAASSVTGFFKHCNTTIDSVCNTIGNSTTQNAWVWDGKEICMVGYYRPSLASPAQIQGASQNCTILLEGMASGIGAAALAQPLINRASLNINTAVPGGFPSNTTKTGVSLVADEYSWIVQPMFSQPARPSPIVEQSAQVDGQIAAPTPAP